MWWGLLGTSVIEHVGSRNRGARGGPDADRKRFGRAPPADHLQDARSGDGRGAARSDRAGGEVGRARVAGAVRRLWAAFVLEGTTGWRFVVEEIERAGHTAHLADPAETAAKRGRKRRAKTDNADCDLQLRLLLTGELPES